MPFVDAYLTNITVCYSFICNFNVAIKFYSLHKTKNIREDQSL